MASARPVIVWFRDDLRLSDHPALHGAASRGVPVVGLYVRDEQGLGRKLQPRAPSGARRAGGGRNPCARSARVRGAANAHLRLTPEIRRSN
ncbi:deoxyribodipyrimidine photo-lyase [Bradyrhizobium macuxiense]|uniref:deoxyribodipyrimidine photo-lyase n=1 Tax=Bradyrhizobium macuxiense TaxID=1755647 RepID=UPI003D9BA9A6